MTEELTSTVVSKEDMAEILSRKQDGQFLETTPLESASTDIHSSLSMGRTILLISTLTATVFAGSMNTGVTTVGLPQLRIDLQLPNNLLLWSVLA